MLSRKRFSFPNVLRIFGLVLSAAGLTITMRGLFLPWLSGYSVVTGLDFWVHNDWLTILSYSLAWIVFLMYCFKPKYVGLCTTLFSHIIFIFYIRLQLLVVFGHRGTPDNIFESGGGSVDFPLTPEPGLSNTFVGIGLILIGVFIGSNNQNQKSYTIEIIAIKMFIILGTIIGSFSLLIGLIYLLS